MLPAKMAAILSRGRWDEPISVPNEMPAQQFEASLVATHYGMFTEFFQHIHANFHAGIVTH